MGGKKRVVISGYDAIKELLMDNGQHTKTRSPASRGKLLTRHYKDTPGIIYKFSIVDSIIRGPLWSRG